ncbi:hypothetical protein RHECNPAF_73005 [Rhizobium etli CNPAF512]|nr:hypothetical protein RHECNPAF_73005 [Rhizobium etli CNPAF512]
MDTKRLPPRRTFCTDGLLTPPSPLPVSQRHNTYPVVVKQVLNRSYKFYGKWQKHMIGGHKDQRLVAAFRRREEHVQRDFRGAA